MKSIHDYKGEYNSARKHYARAKAATDYVLAPFNENVIKLCGELLTAKMSYREALYRKWPRPWRTILELDNHFE